MARRKRNKSGRFTRSYNGLAYGSVNGLGDFGGFRLFGFSATTLALIAGGVYLWRKRGATAARPVNTVRQPTGPVNVATTPQGAVPALLTPGARSAQMRQNIRAKLPVNNVGRA